MDGNDYIELVEQAKFGSRESLDDLAQRVRGRLYAYVYRITLRDDLSQDIVQESLLEMINNLNKLESNELFWPWLRSIAFNKIRRHYKSQKRRRTISLSSFDDWLQPSSKESQAGAFKLMGDEIRQIVFDAMKRLKPHYRAVLSMRCYEDMQYSQIAQLMGNSELNVRVMFYRAKSALHKQLSRKGFKKGFLLSALALFGKMTAPAEAAASPITVTAAATNIGVTATLVAAASSKTSIVTTIVAAGTIAASSTLAPIAADKAALLTDSIHQKMTNAQTVALQQNSEQNESWYYYPAKTNGPVMTRMIKKQPQTARSYCQYLESDQANYYFDRNTNTIHIKNSRMYSPDFSVRRLPTDNPDLAQFLSKLNGASNSENVGYITSNDDGLLVITGQDENFSQSDITHHYNVLDEEYFRYDWPVGAKVIDNRDTMHKRGWTYFRITGHIDGEEVSGTGRIPFVFAESKHHYPWLKLNVADRLEIADSPTGAQIREKEGKILIAAHAVSFFKGLPRPWMGLHTIDTIRRDAAELQLQFETKLIPGNSKAEVVINSELHQLTYTIDMEKDVIEKIVLTTRTAPWKEKAQFNFFYLDDIEQVDDEFTEPRIRTYPGIKQQDWGLLWLSRLVEAEFD